MCHLPETTVWVTVRVVISILTCSGLFTVAPPSYTPKLTANRFKGSDQKDSFRTETLGLENFDAT